MARNQIPCLPDDGDGLLGLGRLRRALALDCVTNYPFLTSSGGVWPSLVSRRAKAEESFVKRAEFGDDVQFFLTMTSSCGKA